MTARSRITIGIAALAAALSAAASAPAADLALRGSLPAYEAGPNWGGFYIGGFGGFGSMTMGTNAAGQNYINNVLNGYAFADGSSQATVISGITRLNPINANPRVFGGFIGYQAQFEDAVVGVELDYARLSGSDGGVSVFTPPASLLVSGDAYTDTITPTVGVAARLHDYWTLRGRAGWAYGRIMPYMTGGLAIARGTTSLAYIATCTRTGVDTASGSTQCVGGAATAASDRGRVGFGFTLGTGIEALLTDNIFVRAEYQYLRIPSVAGIPVTLHTARAGIGIKY